MPRSGAPRARMDSNAPQPRSDRGNNNHAQMSAERRRILEIMQELEEEDRMTQRSLPPLRGRSNAPRPSPNRDSMNQAQMSGDRRRILEIMQELEEEDRATQLPQPRSQDEHNNSSNNETNISTSEAASSNQGLRANGRHLQDGPTGHQPPRRKLRPQPRRGALETDDTRLETRHNDQLRIQRLEAELAAAKRQIEQLTTALTVARGQHRAPTPGHSAQPSATATAPLGQAPDYPLHGQQAPEYAPGPADRHEFQQETARRRAERRQLERNDRDTIKQESEPEGRHKDATKVVELAPTERSQASREHETSASTGAAELDNTSNENEGSQIQEAAVMVSAPARQGDDLTEETNSDLLDTLERNMQQQCANTEMQQDVADQEHDLDQPPTRDS